MWEFIGGLVVAAVSGGLGFWAKSLKTAWRQDDFEERLDSKGDSIKSNKNAIAKLRQEFMDFKTHVAEHYTKRDDLTVMSANINLRLDRLFELMAMMAKGNNKGE